MESEYVIETGIPLPAPGKGKQLYQTKADKYRIRELKPGQCVFIPNVTSNRITGTIAGYRRSCMERFPNRKLPTFATRQMIKNKTSGVRIFRLT